MRHANPVRKIGAGLLALSLILGISSYQQARAQEPEEAPVTVYADANYEGASQSFGLGDYGYYDLVDGIGNDTMSSIRIAQGYRVTLYNDANFQGDCRELTQDELNFKNLSFNDKVSALRVEEINPVDDSCIVMEDWSEASMAAVMEAYAPRIWMAQGEIYWPSSVEFALPYLERTWNEQEGHFYFTTKEPLSRPDSKLDFFAGDLAGARCYSFWVEKAYGNIDISYFQYCPYNYGKKVAGTEFGDHVGDWEHITVRFAKFTYDGVDYLKPIQVKYPSHNFSNAYRWDETEKVEGTHVVGYSAYASHGMWKDPGTHVYLNIVISKLKDECSQGTAWDTWTCLETYFYSAQERTGFGIGGSQWQSYFDVDYTNPDSLSVYRWGNRKEGSAFGQDKLSDGPTAPQEKWALSDYVIFD